MVVISSVRSINMQQMSDNVPVSPHITSSTIDSTKGCGPHRLDTSETQRLGVSCSPLTHPRFPDFPWGGLPWVGAAAGAVDFCFCFEFTGMCSLLISDFWAVWSFATCDCRLYFPPFLCTHVIGHTRAPSSLFTVLFFSNRTHTSLPLTTWTWKLCFDLGCIIIVR